MVAMKNSAFSVMAMGAVGVTALTTSSSATKSGCFWNVAGVGAFNYQFAYTFTPSTYSSATDLTASTYTVNAGNSPLARRFDVVNIGLDSVDNAVTLNVPGGQTNGPVSSSQLVTSYSDILYGSVRTVAKISGVPGTTHGFSFYANDNQEIDFAFLTSNTSMVHLTNEQTSSSAASSSYQLSAPSDATSAYHEYRIDWTSTQTRFYIDSVLVKTITDNVPTSPSFLLWNNWSNGNAWALGPPTADSTLKIQSITAYFNRTSVDTSSCASSTSTSTSTSSATSASYIAAPTSSTTALCPTYNNTIYTTNDGSQYQVACGIDYAGGDFSMSYVANLQGCMELCENTSGCIDVSLSGNACYLKNTLKPAQKNANVNAAKRVVKAI